MVIDTVPDIFVTGHVHGAGLSHYKGVRLINASTWQSQTLSRRCITSRLTRPSSTWCIWDRRDGHAELYVIRNGKWFFFLFLAETAADDLVKDEESTQHQHAVGNDLDQAE